MKKQSKDTVGKAVKYKRVKFDVAKIIALYKSGKPVSAIAVAIGFPPNCTDRTRRVRAGPSQTHTKEGRQEKGGLKARLGRALLSATPQP